MKRIFFLADKIVLFVQIQLKMFKAIRQMMKIRLEATKQMSFSISLPSE